MFQERQKFGQFNPLHPFSQNCPHYCLSDSSSVGLSNDGLYSNKVDHWVLPLSAPLKSIQNRHLLSVSFFQAFGAPFIVAHIDGKREVFFGSDRFHVMAMVIGECRASVYTASSVITAAVVACLLFILDAFL